jgi:hypothetical protein
MRNHIYGLESPTSSDLERTPIKSNSLGHFQWITETLAPKDAPIFARDRRLGGNLSTWTDLSNNDGHKDGGD